MKRKHLSILLLSSMAFLLNDAPTSGQVASSFEQQLKTIDPDLLAKEARLRGDPKRGAVVFYMSAAGCVKCHEGGKNATPLGPDLATIGRDATDLYVIESLLYPSKSIRKGYEILSLLTEDGKVISGLLAKETDKEIFLRDSVNLEKEISVSKDEIEERTIGKKSMMPEGLIDTIRSQREFLDLVSYVLEVAIGGPDREAALKPSPEQLVVKDDTGNLNHARILKSLKDRDFDAGKEIYHGLCNSCHGADGNTPSLPTARAFGTQKLKFGADPYSMFMTLSRGNGLMAPTTHLTPKERYQVVHYIRERFMKPTNPDYQPTKDEYIDALPKGTEMGDIKPSGERDFGPALASQLGPDVTSALTVKLGSTTLSYNLHTLDLAGAWQGGFLDLNQTQHMRGRGEGYPQPKGTKLIGLDGWQWGHQGTMDYSHEGLLPRGPLPAKWLDYKGHYLNGDRIVLSYAIDGREILELPQEQPDTSSVRHILRIGAGDALVLATAMGVEKKRNKIEGVIPSGSLRPLAREGSAVASIALNGQIKDDRLGDFTAATVLGEANGMTWRVDDQQRLVLRIPADTQSRLIEIVCYSGTGDEAVKTLHGFKTTALDPASLVDGGRQRWPEVLDTVGYRGLGAKAYVADQITIPESTPWNTWFRTSALDFFPDGRMVVATCGGDIWIVSGVDDDLLNLKWKRFAGGLFEPFGVKVVDGLIYVACRDRLTRLHDVNRDEEADFYESFSTDTDVSSFFHAFNFDLHTDSEGNFYYAKCGQYTSYALPGSVMKVSADGKKREVYCTGFRTPNGMGMLPDNRMTVSDNQGSWMPASKVSLVKPNGFYGYVQTHAGGKGWAPDGGKIDHTKVIPPKTFDQPLIWMPQDLDNSSGGQIWVDDPRWGPLSGRLLHTSFGKGWLCYLMMQDVGDASQAAIIKMPIDFGTGIMRGRVNPKDGQVYVTGLNGWNEGGRRGLADNGIERVRYTGKPINMLTDCQVEHDGLRLSFNFRLDPTTASDVASFVTEQWNYKWAASYGSDMYDPKTGKVGKESVKISSAKISDDGKSIQLVVPGIQPVNQLHMLIQVKDREGIPFAEEIYWTINRIPPASN